MSQDLSKGGVYPVQLVASRRAPAINWLAGSGNEGFYSDQGRLFEVEEYGR